jgi:hypothetical protein
VLIDDLQFVSWEFGSKTWMSWNPIRERPLSAHGHDYPATRERQLSTDCVEKVRRRRSDERMIRDGAHDGNELMLNGSFRFEYC